ncbi:MAG: penicillin-binding transpeptidase domain-containing protein [Chloroflexi bacterium]|nr:penicillin-binding transpeptidase domain-containing protein [Chloroflexota bacterium]MCL5076382.1 penicillin-binding transpeptidase domain-containing protein [Chloroflexota bacterium]
MKQNIRGLALLFVLFFTIVGLDLGYWQVIRAAELTNNIEINRYRLLEGEKQTKRGRILDRNGIELAKTELTPEGARRIYPQPWLVHVTGYHSFRYGDSNIEKSFDKYLRGATGLDLTTSLKNDLFHRPTTGSDVVLTIDSRLQKIAEAALGQRKGAIVALDPRSGAILALASHPYFDPNTLEHDWSKLREDPDQPLLNRATQGLYTPGSTFKTVTLSAALETGTVKPSDTFTDATGVFIVDGFPIRDDNHPGITRFDLFHAYAYSCNVSFARIGLALGADRLSAYARAFGFGSIIPLEIPTAASQIMSTPDFLRSRPALASTAFGQGQLQATPLEMALIAATIANGGLTPQPYLVARVQSPDGRILYTANPKTWRKVISEQTAEAVKQAMIISVEEGWAKPARIPDVAVAGKTGSAEVIPGLPTHAWFIGFAPADKPQIAVAVIKEYAGGGSTEATPSGRQVIEAALKIMR